MQILAEDWAEDFDGFDLELLDRAARKIRRVNRFFPCTAEVFAMCEELRREDERLERARLEAVGEDMAIDYEYQKRKAQALLEHLQQSWDTGRYRQ